MGLSVSRTEVRTNEKPSEFLRYGATSALGGRQTQEDAFWALPASYQPGILNGFWRGFYVVSQTLLETDLLILQVCDGHGGSDAAVFTSRNLLRFMLLHDSLLHDASRALVWFCVFAMVSELRLVR